MPTWLSSRYKAVTDWPPTIVDNQFRSKICPHIDNITSLRTSKLRPMNIKHGAGIGQPFSHPR